jgi:hypothetical protein
VKTLNLKYISKDYLESFVSQNNIAKEKNILLQIFTGVCETKFIEKLITDVKELVADIKIVGSTTSGEIMDGAAQTNSTVLSFSIFKKTTIKTYKNDFIEDSYTTANSLINQFDNKSKAKVAITFADGLHVNGEEYINAFHDYDSSMIIAGGLAGDNSNFIKTVVFTEDGISENGGVVALLYNDELEVLTDASFGWEQIGKKMTITKADANIVYTINDEKAAGIYGKYLGEDIEKELPNIGVEFPLIIQKDSLSIPRAVMGRNSDGSLIFAGNLSTGDIVTFGYGNIQAILKYVNKIDNDINIQNSESIFVYSCMARLKLLGESVNNELAHLKYISSNVSGFFTYGEFYSNIDLSKHELLNQTMTFLSLSEGVELKEDKSVDKDILKQKDRRKSSSLTLKALSHLIMQTSKELEEVNLSLLDRVKYEVAKNRQKDQTMLHQSKLAQMGEMISMIAHQWRQPLTAISATSNSLKLKAQIGNLDKKTTIELSEKITEYSQHLSDTINDFREFFRPKKEQKETTYREIIDSVLGIIEVSIITKNISIVKDLKDNSIFNSYPNEIKQVVLNLIKNAEDVLLEREIEDAYIKLSTYKEDDTHIIEISDNAGGVPEDIIDKIFEPYFSTKKGKDGTGLGLYMSKIIIEEHCAGRLSVYNNKEGAVFKVQIS